jgi:ABC-type transport system involved in cytochrome bd biosynthesis fused ATPase/permease subunit
MKGKTTLVITHKLEEAEKMERTVVMSEGKVV